MALSESECLPAMAGETLDFLDFGLETGDAARVLSLADRFGFIVSDCLPVAGVSLAILVRLILEVDCPSLT